MKKITFTLLLFLMLPLFSGASVNQTKEPAKETTVLICTGKYATKYHSHKCKGLSNCKGTIKKITLSDAIDKKFTPCGYCYKKDRK